MSTIGGLEGTTAVVTGGGSGIGYAVVELLDRSGATVRVVDLSHGARVDVTDRAALGSVADEVEAAHGGLDILVNAAGVLTPNLPADELPADDFRRAYEVNVVGTVNACQAFFPLLQESRGAIVNVASQAALVSLPQQAARPPRAPSQRSPGRSRSTGPVTGSGSTLSRPASRSPR